MESDHQVLTVREVSDLLQIHQSTVYKMIREGRIPGFQIGGIWRLRRDWLVRWMAEQGQRPQ